MLKQKDDTQDAYTSETRAQLYAEHAPEHAKEAPWRDYYTRPSIPLKHTLR